jgi:glycosyltransferase involved in cell wall biosynthesis
MKLIYIAFPKSSHTLKWVNHFKNKHDIMLVSFYPADRIAGIDIRYLPVMNKNLTVMQLPGVKKLIAEFKPDIIHAHYATSCGLAAALSGFHPFVLSVWGDDILAFPNKSPLHKWLMRKIINAADYVSATSHMLAKSTSDLIGGKRKIEVIPFGVDLKHYQFRRREDKDIVHIGTVRKLARKYGLEFLIKAISKLTKSGYKIKLTIVGSGELRSKLEALTRRLDLGEQVNFAGFVPNPNVVDYLDQFDIFVMPSVEEGETFGVAAVEAMATGLPVIASKIGGLPEVVDHGKTGLHVKPGDVDSLHDALKKYIDSPELRYSHGKEGRHKVEQQYNWEENAKLIEKLYETAGAHR